MVIYTTQAILVGIGKGTIIVAGYSNTEITTYTATRTRRCTFTKVLHVPNIVANLLSTELLRTKGIYYRSDRQYLFAKYTDGSDVVVADVYIHNRLPYLVEELVTALYSSTVAVKAEASMLVQHLRLGHIYLRKLLAIAKKGDITITRNRTLNYVAYLIAQSYRVYSRIPTVRPTLVYYLVSVDVVLVREPSLTKDQYFTLFTEAKALEREVTFLLYKSSAAVSLKNYYLQRKNAGYSIVVFRLDRGKEYGGNALLLFAADNSIRLQIIPLYTSIKNSRAKVSNYIVCTNARKIIIYANLLLALQLETTAAAVYILNLTPSAALDGDYLRHVADIALRRAINTKKLLLNNLRAYSATAIAFDHKVARSSKFQSRRLRSQLVGYKDSMYRIWIPLEHKVIRTLYCQFIEDSELAELLNTELDIIQDFEQNFEYNIIEPRGNLLTVPEGYTVEAIDDDCLSDNEQSAPTNEDAQDNVLEAAEATLTLLLLPTIGRDTPSNSELDEGYEQIRPGLLDVPIDKNLLRSLRSRRKTAKARTYYSLANMPQATIKAFTASVTANDAVDIIILKSYKELQLTIQRDKQRAATYREFRMYIKNRTQRNVLRYALYKVLRRRQVFSIKRDANRKVSRFKARQVVRRFSQREGIDFNETYAVVAKPVSLRVLFAILAEEDLECY